MNSDQPVSPYIAGAPVTGAEMFFGRNDVFAFIQQNLIGQHRDSPIVLYGQRRTGKTSVLYQLHRHLPAGYRCVFIDMHGLNLDGMGNVLLGIANSISRFLKRYQGLTVAVPDRGTFLADPRSEFEDTFLEKVWSVLGEDHLVLMMDEVIRLDEEVNSGRLERGIFDYLRHLMQHHPRLNFIFSLGSGLEDMERNYAFLFNVTLYHRISFLQPDAARELITEPVRDCYQVAPEAVGKILQVTSRHPYYTQLVCHCMFNSWSRSPRPLLNEADVDAALAEAIELGSPNLAYVWEESTSEERALMAGMAAAMGGENRPVSMNRIRKAWRTVKVSLPERAATHAVHGLTVREVVTGSHAYSFVVDLQRIWLDQHRPLDWVKEQLSEDVQAWNQKAARRSRYITAAVAVLVLAGALAGTGVAHVFPFSSGSGPGSDLVQLMQGELYLGNHHCGPAERPAHWSAPGLVRAIQCTDQFLPGGNIYGYEMDSTADFKAARQSLNEWWGFLPQSAAKKCPPDEGTDGLVSDGNLSLSQSDVITQECGYMKLTSTETVPVYAWAFPESDALIIATGASGSSYSALVNMPTQPVAVAASTPSSSPTPIPPSSLTSPMVLSPANFLATGAGQYPCSAEVAIRSVASGTPVPFYFVNNSPDLLQLIWITYNGSREVFKLLLPGGTYSVNTYVGQVWMLADTSASCQGIFDISSTGWIEVVG